MASFRVRAKDLSLTLFTFSVQSRCVFILLSVCRLQFSIYVSIVCTVLLKRRARSKKGIAALIGLNLSHCHFIYIYTRSPVFFLSSTSYSLLIICNCATVSVYISVTAQSLSLFGIHSLYRMDVCSRAHSTICRESTGWKRNGEKNHVKCNDNHNILFSRLLFI